MTSFSEGTGTERNLLLQEKARGIMNKEETRRTEGWQNRECFPVYSCQSIFLPVPKSPVLRARSCSTLSESPSQNPLQRVAITPAISLFFTY